MYEISTQINLNNYVQYILFSQKKSLKFFKIFGSLLLVFAGISFVMSIVEFDTFDNFILDYYSEQPMENAIVPRQRAEKIFDTCRKYAQNFSLSSKNLIFFGGAGLGKTHLSLAIANVVINKGYNVCYGTSQNICDDLQSEQFGRTDNITYTKNQVLMCDLLVLDDLGTEIDNQYSIAALYNIVNSRLLSGRPTIISTNYTFDRLEEKYDKRITSRLTGEYVPFYFIGNDIRNM